MGLSGEARKYKPILRSVDVQQLRSHRVGRASPACTSLPIARRQIDVPPAVAVADPGETLTVGQPLELVVDINPGIVSFGQDVRHLPRAWVRQQDADWCSAGDSVAGAGDVLESGVHASRAR